MDDGANVALFGFCFGVLSNYIAIYSHEALGITGGTGTFFLLCSAGLIASRLQGGRALRKGRLTSNAAEGMCLSLTGYVLFVALPALFGDSDIALWVSYYGSALLIGLGNGHLWPAFLNMTINVAQNNQRGTANSTILTSWDVGVGLGILRRPGGRTLWLRRSLLGGGCRKCYGRLLVFPPHPFILLGAQPESVGEVIFGNM